MSTDYSASLAIGYEVAQEQLDRFKVRTDPVWHMEARFNPRTGEKLPDEKVIEVEAGFVYRWNGAEYDYVEDLVNDICEKLNCSYHTSMEYPGVYEDGDQLFVIGPKLKHTPEAHVASVGRLDVYGHVRFQDVLAMGEELNRIGQELLKMGIIKTVDQSEVYVTLCASEH